MNINEFVNQRKEDWKKLETIAGKFRPGTTPKLSREELWELGRLYVSTVSDLSLLKSSDLGSDSHNQVAAYLNGLVIRVHGVIYRKEKFKWKLVRDFLLTGFPKAFRSGLPYIAGSAAVFLFFGTVGFVLTLTEPGFIELFMPERIIERVEQGKVWFNDIYSIAPMVSSQLMTNNISVTLLAVAAGITFGLGTFYVLALNGALVGGAAALCYRHGLSMEFWSFILPHGSLELSAIFISGGAGFIIGHALLDPGPYRRWEYLSVRGQVAARLAMGLAPMLVLAGIIEAFFSPSPVPPWGKIIFAVVVFACLMIFLLTSGKTVSASETS